MGISSATRTSAEDLQRPRWRTGSPETAIWSTTWPCSAGPDRGRFIGNEPKPFGSCTPPSTETQVPVVDRHSPLPETCRQHFRTPLAAAGGLPRSGPRRGLQGSQDCTSSSRALHGKVAALCSESGNISSECTVIQAQSREAPLIDCEGSHFYV